MQIVLNNQKIKYTFKKSKRAKKLRLSISCNAGLTVTAPRLVNRWMAEKFIKQKADWIIKTINRVQEKSQLFKTVDKGYQEHKEEARERIVSRVEYFGDILSADFNRVAIKKQKRIWGSCSVNKNLNFNYRLLFLPAELLDYVIVHELCHLKEMNHSRNFWNLVEKVLPDYKSRRRELKKIMLALD